MSIIEVNQVTKEFRLGQLRTLRQTVADGLAWCRGAEVERRALFKALDEITFKVEEGEVLGIIGHNGAGKSTLLKLLARISRPTRGTVAVRGAVAPLIEVGAGLAGDLTGRENIYLNATILGMRRAEIKRKFDEIVAFAELSEFIDTPLKRYSSGMQVRLGFSIATSVDADILIVDEVLSVGDLAFQRKCFDRMEELIKRQGKTVLIVSHNLRQVERLCPRVILLDRGQIIADGPGTDTCNLFYDLSDKKIRFSRLTPTQETTRFESSGEVELQDIAILDRTGTRTTEVEYGKEITVLITYKINATLKNPVFGIGVHTTDFIYLATNQSQGQLEIPELQVGTYQLRCRLDSIPFLPGVYSLRVGVAVGEFLNSCFYAENVISFQVVANTLNRAWSSQDKEGFVALPASWALLESDTEPVCTPTGGNAASESDSSGPELTKSC